MDSGQTIFGESYTARAERFGGVYMVCMHRADLLESLSMRVPPERIRVSSRLVALEERPDRVVAQLESGEEVVGGVVVGADGLRSTVRTILFASSRHASRASPRGGTIPAADMPPGFEPHSFVAWLGPHRHAMTFPIRADLQTFNGFVPTTEILREEWDHPVTSKTCGVLRRCDIGRAEVDRPNDIRADHAALLPRPTAGVGN